MKLYEIDQQLEELLSNIDEETGELLIDPEAVDALMLAREEKLEGIALWVKDLRAEAAMVKAEEITLHDRRTALENRADRVAAFLQNYLNGDTFKSAKVSVSYRKSQKVELDLPVFMEHPAEAFLRRKDPEPDKAAIKAALKDGGIIPGAQLVDTISMTIK